MTKFVNSVLQVNIWLTFKPNVQKTGSKLTVENAFKEIKNMKKEKWKTNKLLWDAYLK